ncbi:MAG: type 4a pilus biogenesis protein PilO [Candidatus Cloacimonetes bacterium]|nr:type 4a pilus biogenesis protein PilO [Candidatus Cloacimonadota bacterium]
MKNYRFRLLSTISAVLFLFAVFNVLIPMYTEIGRNSRTLRENKLILAKNSDFDTEIVKIKNEISRLKKNFQKILNINEISGNLSSFIKNVSNKATDSGIILNSIKPIKNSKFETYESSLIELNVSGTFNQIGFFLDELENSNLFLIKFIEIKKNEKTKLLDSTIRFELILLKKYETE